MALEILVGLPHLSKGALLNRACSLQQPALISANSLSRWSRRRGWPEWRGWHISRLENAHGLSSLALDSAGFVASARYGGFPWTIAQYVELASAFPFRWWASVDYCTEAEIAVDREEVLDRISRTIRANLECQSYGEGRGIADRFMPVIQGQRPEDYERCLGGLWHFVRPGATIGVGSMCRREIRGSNGLIAVIDHLDRILPSGVGLHIFGAKGAAIPYLRAFEDRIASLDSQAYGVGARRDALRRGISKSDAFVADHMEAWLQGQNALRCGRIRHVPVQPGGRRDLEPLDPWEAAIAEARAQIRELIASGDLDHDEVTTGWIEEWAAGLYRRGHDA